MIYGLYVFAIMYSLGAILLLAITEAAEEDNPNADLNLALLWPYIAVRVILERIVNGPYKDDE
jgi:hypothetical protein